MEDGFLNFELTYTDPYEEDNIILRDKLYDVWLKEIGLSIPKERIWIYKTNTLNAANRNLFGALSIREHKQLSLNIKKNI